MRPIPFLALASVIALGYAAMTTPIHQPFPAMAAKRAASAPFTPMDADDGRLPPSKGMDRQSIVDRLNDRVAQADVLLSCDLLSVDAYNAFAGEDEVRRERLGEASLAELARDKAYIAGERETLALRSCGEVGAMPWALAWRSDGF